MKLEVGKLTRIPNLQSIHETLCSNMTHDSLLRKNVNRLIQ